METYFSYPTIRLPGQSSSTGGILVVVVVVVVVAAFPFPFDSLDELFPFDSLDDSFSFPFSLESLPDEMNNIIRVIFHSTGCQILPLFINEAEYYIEIEK